MKKALVAVALLLTIIVPAAHAQGNENIPVKNALVVILEHESPVSQAVMKAAGSPSSTRALLDNLESLLGITTPYTTSDSDGKFEFNVPLSSGSYNVSAFAPGYVATSSDTARFSVDSGKTSSANVTLFLKPSAVVTGRVTDEGGNPISGVVVSAGGLQNHDVTMDDGIFVLDSGLKSGEYDLHAFKPGIDAKVVQDLFNRTGILTGNEILAGKAGILNTKNPGYASTTATVSLEQGKLTTFNIQMKDSGVISGLVTDIENRPVSNAAVFAFDAKGNMANVVAITDSEGKYSLSNDLAAGKYKIVVPGIFSSYASAEREVTIPSTDIKIDFVLQKSSSVSGRVVDASGNGLANATISLISKDMHGGSVYQFLAGGIGTAGTDPEGRFKIDSGIGRGEFLLSASFGNIAPAMTSISISVNGSILAKKIVLDFDKIITASGRVLDTDGNPISNALVLPSFIPNYDLLAPRTDSTGSFVIVIPFKDANIVDEVTVSADGYKPTTVKVQDGKMHEITLENMPVVKINGVVIAQKPASPLIESVLVRTGTLYFEHSDDEYKVGVQTNSRITGTQFDQPDKQIKFKVETVEGSPGEFEFLIPKNFLGGPFIVTLDGEVVPPENVRTSENKTHAIIAFEHERSIQDIAIQGATVVPEFPAPLILISAAFAAVLLVSRPGRIFR